MKVIIVVSGHELPTEITRQETVLEIKQRLEQFLGIPISSQTLAVYGLELVDGLDMDDYPIITEGTKIHLTIEATDYPPSNGYSKMQVVVKFPTRKINVQVDQTETVHSLKEKIHILEGTPIPRMSLFFSGTELEDDFRSLTEYGVGESSEIVVFLKNISRQRHEPPSRRLGIVVQTSSSLLNAATIPLEMKDTCTVGDLRQMLLSRKILPADDYIFIHKQRLMRCDCSLRWHGVENGETLYVFRGTVTRGSL
ncbi:uncharacterized protein LOC115682264 [Syzygium oleosum]|uniref:uncharacterized protein LOC115682264 n=1 Tax=Syzygium oleosum TaxID=219896 RepID=UPI0011D1FB57|nr:uncharacterized protein LOC115682264 [Syzygium oleosum]